MLILVICYSSSRSVNLRVYWFSVYPSKIKVLALMPFSVICIFCLIHWCFLYFLSFTYLVLFYTLRVEFYVTDIRSPCLIWAFKAINFLLSTTLTVVKKRIWPCSKKALALSPAPGRQPLKSCNFSRDRSVLVNYGGPFRP